MPRVQVQCCLTSTETLRTVRDSATDALGVCYFLDFNVWSTALAGSPQDDSHIQNSFTPVQTELGTTRTFRSLFTQFKQNSGRLAHSYTSSKDKSLNQSSIKLERKGGGGGVDDQTWVDFSSSVKKKQKKSKKKANNSRKFLFSLSWHESISAFPTQHLMWFFFTFF